MLATVATRLGAHAPFDALDAAALQRLAETIEIRYAEAGERLFHEGADPAAHAFQVQKGSVALARGFGDDAAGDASPDRSEGVLVALADEGDLVGFRAHLAKRPYAATATTREPCLLYVVPVAALDALMDAHPALSGRLAATFAADAPLRGEALAAAMKHSRASVPPGRASLPPGAPAGLPALSLFDETRQLEPIRDLVTTGKDATVAEAARAMAARNVGSILVLDEGRRPIGILTDSDLRKRVVAAERVPAQTRVEEVMSAPVLTAPEGESLARVLERLLGRRLKHLVLTEDGTPDSPVKGVLSEHDLLTAHGNLPTVVLSDLRRARDREALRRARDRGEALLRQYLDAEVSMTLIASLATAMNDRLIRRALALARVADAESSGAPLPAFAWLSLGSEGRGEQLLRTDQDNALVFADPVEGAAALRPRFLALGEHVVATLEAAGFVRCPGNVMGSNPELCLSVSEWKEKLGALVRVPEPRALMEASIYFDLRHAGGEGALPAALRAHVHAQTREAPRFLTFLARNALQNPPPLSFFRGFMVERSGTHEDRFDVKARAMMPLADAARVLAVDAALEEVGTAARFRALAAREAKNAGLYEEAALAYELLMRLRARSGLAHGDSGRFLAIEAMGKLQRQALRSTFAVIDDVQTVLEARYRTDLLR